MPECMPKASLPAEEPQRYQRSYARSAEAEIELASFEWPITEVDELRRLLRCEHIAPTWLLLGEFTGAQAEQL